MKKIIFTIILSLIISLNINAEEFNIKNEDLDNKWLKNKTVNDLIQSGFHLFTDEGKFHNKDNTVWSLYRKFKNSKQHILVVCISSPENTNCYLP